MPNTVLGKVSVVPKGDYSTSTTYYALDIVGYNGGSYLAMQQVTGVTPSNDGVNWMQLSGPGLPGQNGTNGVTFTPSVSEAGVISWTNDGEEENPDPVDIMGPPGAAAGFGTVTATADNTSSETPSVDVQSSGPDTAKNFTFAFTGLKGNPGETPDIEIGTVNTLEPGQDATADITGTTPNLTLSLGIPKGQPGTSVSRIERTSGTGAAGTTDTYTMYDSNDDAIGTFTVYNGANGAGAGDLMADGSVPMTGPLNMGGSKITNLGAPGADTDAVRKSDLDAVAAEVDGILDGTTPVHLSPATDTKIGGVIIGDGLSVEADGTLSADDQLPTGGTQGQVLTQGTTGPEWQDAPSGLPDGGTPGQVLTQGESGPEWTDAPDPLPTGGETGQVLTKTADGVAWEDAPEGGVTSFKGRTGAVTPQEGDYTADMVGARPDTWMPSASDVGAIPNPSGGTTGQILEKTATGTQWADKPSGGMTQTEADARYLQLSGGTMTGDLTVEGKLVFGGSNGPKVQVGPSNELQFNSASGGSVQFLNVQVGGTPTQSLDIVNKAYVDSLAAKSTTVTLTTSGWSSNTQTVTVSGVSADETAQLIMPVPALASQTAYYEAGILVTGQAANRLTFTCSTVPTSNLTVYVVMQEVQ